MACPRAKGEHTVNIARMRTIRFNGWPPLAGVWDWFDFSVVEVALGIPALFEDILMIPVVWANLTKTESLLSKASLRSIRRS
jgi:hypothetical protein